MLADGTPIELDSDNMVVTATLRKGSLLMTPRQGNESADLLWSCAAADGLKEAALPLGCRAPK